MYMMIIMLAKQHKGYKQQRFESLLNTQLISTRWKHPLEKIPGMKINHQALHKSTMAGESHGEHASNQSQQTPRGEASTAEG